MGRRLDALVAKTKGWKRLRLLDEKQGWGGEEPEPMERWTWPYGVVPHYSARWDHAAELLLEGQAAFQQHEKQWELATNGYDVRTSYSAMQATERQFFGWLNPKTLSPLQITLAYLRWKGVPESKIEEAQDE